MALDMASPFVWGSGGRRLTPEEILAERKAATALGSEAMSTAPVGHWSAGLNRIAQGLMAGYDSYAADQASKTNAAESSSVAQALFGAAPAAAVAPSATGAAITSAPLPAVAGTTVSTPMGGTSIPVGDKEAFIAKYAPIAEAASKQTGIDPRIILAQAGLETGWGKSMPGNNLFGIKSHGAPGGNVLPTTEVVNGQPVRMRDSFAAYESPEAAGTGYADFMLKNKRYEPVRAAQGLEAQAAALGQSGYATDPTYGTKILEIARGLPGGAVSNMPAVSPQAPSNTPVVAPQSSSNMPVVGQTTEGRPAINPAILKAITSPYVSDDVKKMGFALFQSQLASDKVQTIDLGNAVGIMDARGNIVKTVPKGEPNKGPEYGVIGKDEFGNEQYGWRDPRTQSVTPYKPIMAPPTGEPSTIPPAPKGVDPKVWRESQSKNAAANALPGSFDDTHKLRNEFTALPAYKNMAQAAPVYQSMRDAAGRDTKAADLNIVYGLGKIMDPGSVVREGEIQMANNAQGWQEKLNGLIAQINEKGALTPEGRQALMAEAHSRIMAYKQQYDFDVGRYGGIAERNRINKADVIPDFGTFEPWTAPKNAAPVEIDGYKIKAR